MSKRIDRAIHGPSWTEVFLGAVLSLVLGVAIAIVLLIIKPVIVVKALPKEADRDPTAVYYVEGVRTGSRASQALVKKKDFVEGRSISVMEDELNSLAASLPEAKTGESKAGAKSSDTTKETFAAGMLNFRIHDGTLQVGAPIIVNFLGITQKAILQARGRFEKRGGVFAFVPNEVYLGSCPIQRLPLLAGYVRSKLLAAQSVPADMAAAWGKVTNVAIEGDMLKVTMP